MSTLIIDKLLADNGLIRKEVPEGQNSLMRAISDALYLTSQYNDEISAQLVKFLKRMISTNQVPLNLSILETNLALQQDYCSHPNFIGFDKINLELVSMLFRVKVVVYQAEDDWLTAKIVNKNYTNTIEIVKHNNHYDTVHTRAYLENVTIAQQQVFEIVNLALQDNARIPTHFRNIQQELWMQEKINLQIDSQKQAAQGGRPRSLSDQFNYDAEKVDALYTSLEAKFTKMFSQNAQPTPKPVEKKGQLDMDYASSQILKLQSQLDNLATGGKQSVGKPGVSKFDISDEIVLQQQQDQMKNIRGPPPGIQAPKPANSQALAETPKKPIVIDEGEQRFTGRLKFFDEGKNYGFIVLDTDNSDIFVHADDLQKVGITKEFLRGSGQQYRPQGGVRHFGKGPGQAPRFSFAIMVYVGKYNKSRKAVDLKFLVES